MGTPSDPSNRDSLVAFLARVPAIEAAIASGGANPGWWVKFRIDITDPLAWNAVQELGSVLNYLSIGERLPTIFMPVSPPVYLNGGPDEYLSWVIECNDANFTPDTCREWLEARLPQPVDDRAAWSSDDEEHDEAGEGDA